MSRWLHKAQRPVLATAGVGTGVIRASLSRPGLAPICPLCQQVTVEQVGGASRTLAESGFQPPPMYEIVRTNRRAGVASPDKLLWRGLYRLMRT